MADQEIVDLLPPYPTEPWHSYYMNSVRTHSSICVHMQSPQSSDKMAGIDLFLWFPGRRIVARPFPYAHNNTAPDTIRFNTNSAVIPHVLLDCD